jgi:hypothetical protein
MKLNAKLTVPYILFNKNEDAGPPASSELVKIRKGGQRKTKVKVIKLS